ncbi:hypothetical protein KKG90_00295 [Candidatus Bipolaricaulota bacterium]|nr:hypothetical protein [Candidatus Bipolaricaulota bacterium]
MRTAFAQCLLGVMLCAGISLQTHADYAEERSVLASSIREIIEQGVTSVLIYERDTETPVEEGQMTAQYLARDLYGGVGVSMPIHPANSLQLRSYTATGGPVYHHDADKLNLSTSTLHDLQDWRFVLDAATAAGIELSTYKVADDRTAGAIFNAFAGPPEENAQLPVGWDLSEAIDWADILAASRSLANSYIQGGHSLLGVALHNPQCQLGESILAPDIPGAVLELALLAVPLDKAVKDVAEFSADVIEKVNSGDARPDLMDLVKLGAKIFWDESIGSLIAIGSHVLAADIIVAGSTNDAVLDFEALGIRMSQAQFQALRLSNLASTLSAPFYIDSYAYQESETKHQELMLSAQAAYMAEVISYCDENIRLNQEFPTGYQGAAEYLRGPVRPNHEPMIQNISGFAMNRGACGSCDIHVMDVDGDAIDVYLQGNSPGELRRIDDLSEPGLFVAEYIFCDLDSDSSNVFQVVLSATDNRSPFVEETFTVVLMNVPPCFMSDTGCESRGGISFDGMVLSKGPSVFTMDPAWYEAGCLQFRDLDGDALIFRMTQFPRWGTANLMTSGSGGNYFVTVMYEIDHDAMLACHRAQRDLVDQLTVQASDPYGGVSEATMNIRLDVVNSPPVCENDTVLTPSGVPVTIDVLANDSDPDEDTLTIAEVATLGRLAVGRA